MKKRILFISLLLSLFTIMSIDSFAQEERKYIRKGNKLFHKGDFSGSVVDYLRAIDKDSTSHIAIFNLGDALYKQEKYEEALEKFAKIASDSTILSPYIVETMYNMGNTHFQTKKYQEAVDSYKMALRMNPSDTTAKFNLAYAQLMLQKGQEQQEQQQHDKDNKDNKDNQDNKDQPQDQDKDPKDQNKDQKDDKGDKKEEEQPEPKISKDQAEKMLQAIQGNEDKTQQKVKEKKGKGVAVGTRKNW